MVVLDGDLGLAIRTQIVQHLVATHLGQLFGQSMRQADRKWHQLWCLVAGIAEHHALIAGALKVVGIDGLTVTRLPGPADAPGDVWGLVVEADHHAAGATVDALVCGIETDLEQPLTGQPLDVDVGLGGGLTGHHHHPIGHQRLNRAPRQWIVSEHGV